MACSVIYSHRTACCQPLRHPPPLQLQPADRLKRVQQLALLSTLPHILYLRCHQSSLPPPLANTCRARTCHHISVTLLLRRFTRLSSAWRPSTGVMDRRHSKRARRLPSFGVTWDAHAQCALCVPWRRMETINKRGGQAAGLATPTSLGVATFCPKPAWSGTHWAACCWHQM